MGDRSEILRRTSLEVLSRLLTDTSIFYEDTHSSGLTDGERLAQMRDDLEMAFQTEGEGMRRQVRKTAETAWEYGERFGFMKGMRAGARIVLALVGEGEIRI